MSMYFRIGIVVLVCSALFFIGSMIYSAGAASVQVEWNKAVAAENQANTLKQQRIDKAKDEYHAKLSSVTRELEQARNATQVALANQRAQYDRRLLDSSNRADYYRSLSEAGSAEREHLASYAARLDRSLEEGRYLVSELGATLRLRDAEIKTLAAQIIEDRKLLSTE